MIARIGWFVALFAMTLVTIGVHWDRQAKRNANFATGVPESFRSSAQFAIAASALKAGETAVALAEAEQLVRRRPIPAENLRLLAQTQFAAGQIENGTRTIQYAAQRGWRDPLSQEAMLRIALDAGDTAEAARRYAALFLRRDTEDALLEDLGAIVLAEPMGDGRQTLITITAGGERWHDQFLRRGMRIMPPEAFAEIVSGAAANGARFDCRILRQSFRVVAARDTAAAEDLGSLITQQC